MMNRLSRESRLYSLVCAPTLVPLPSYINIAVWTAAMFMLICSSNVFLPSESVPDMVRILHSYCGHSIYDTKRDVNTAYVHHCAPLPGLYHFHWLLPLQHQYWDVRKFAKQSRCPCSTDGHGQATGRTDITGCREFAGTARYYSNLMISFWERHVLVLSLLGAFIRIGLSI